MQVAVVVGTRAEIIKLCPVVRELGNRAILIHSGQHYDSLMAGSFFEEFGIGAPNFILEGVGGEDRTRQIASIMRQLSEIFSQERYGAVLVQGDTNTASAAAQAGNYAGIPVVHVEAGLRSHDRAMPEELNRRVVGVLANIHCAATAVNVDNLLAEEVPAERIILTGNTIVEATTWSLSRPERDLPVDHQLLSTGILATIHRPENTDSPEALRRIVEALIGLDAPAFLIAHPRTRAALARYGLLDIAEDGLILLPPVSHRQMLSMMEISRLIVTDSGGLQEECTVVKTPLIVVRRSTERPESITAGFSQLVTPDQDLAGALRSALHSPVLSLAGRPSPYGDGRASARIARIAINLADYGHIIHPEQFALANA